MLGYALRATKCRVDSVLWHYTDKASFDVIRSAGGIYVSTNMSTDCDFGPGIYGTIPNVVCQCCRCCNLFGTTLSMEVLWGATLASLCGNTWQVFRGALRPATQMRARRARPLSRLSPFFAVLCSRCRCTTPVQECMGVHKSAQECTGGVYSSTQERTGAHRSAQECTGAHRRIQERTRVCRSMPEYTGVYRPEVSLGPLGSRIV